MLKGAQESLEKLADLHTCIESLGFSPFSILNSLGGKIKSLMESVSHIRACRSTLKGGDKVKNPSGSPLIHT